MPQTVMHSSAEAERQRVQEIIDNRRIEMALANVRRVEFSFGEDSTGDPVVHVVMVVSKDLSPTKEHIEELNVLANILTQDIIRKEIGLWPYVRTIVEE